MHHQSSASSEAGVVTESSEVYSTFILGYAYDLSYFRRTLSYSLLVREIWFLRIVPHKILPYVFYNYFDILSQFWCFSLQYNPSDTQIMFHPLFIVDQSWWHFCRFSRIFHSPDSHTYRSHWDRLEIKVSVRIRFRNYRLLLTYSGISM